MPKCLPNTGFCSSISPQPTEQSVARAIRLHYRPQEQLFFLLFWLCYSALPLSINSPLPGHVVYDQILQYRIVLSLPLFRIIIQTARLLFPS